jgi:GxxExxY protein
MRKHVELTEKIIGCAYKVYNAMGFGYLESVYEKCMLIELEKSGVSATSQVPISVFYAGQEVGNFIADILVEDVVIVELKSVQKIIRAHEVQLVNYLTATDRDVGLILNFSENKVEVKRKLRLLEDFD